jgi:hypothetical protein
MDYKNGTLMTEFFIKWTKKWDLYDRRKAKKCPASGFGGDTILSNMNENKSNSPNEKHNFSSQSLQSTEHQVFDNSSPQEQKSLKTL